MINGHKCFMLAHALLKKRWKSTISNLFACLLLSLVVSLESCARSKINCIRNFFR